MKVNTLNALNAYRKINNYPSSNSKNCANNDCSKSSSKSNTDTISFRSSEQGMKEYESKVSNIKKQVQDGTYKVDADKVAAKILGSLFI